MSADQMEPNPLDPETAKWVYQFIKDKLCDDYWETDEGYDCACGGRQLLREFKRSYPHADEPYT